MPCRTDFNVCMQVHLTVDTAMDTGSIKISAFVARKLTLGDRLLARKFQEVDCEVDTQEIETVGGAPAIAIPGAFSKEQAEAIAQYHAAPLDARNHTIKGVNGLPRNTPTTI